MGGLSLKNFFLNITCSNLIILSFKSHLNKRDGNVIMRGKSYSLGMFTRVQISFTNKNLRMMFNDKIST
jgi:hypothetical protein